MRAGDQVVLRSPGEILTTLDEQGLLDGLPFMPEMLGYFDKTLRVEAQAGRACDTIGYSGVRKLRDTVIVDDLRCDGSAHAGCQAQCRLYWKEAWLRPVSAASSQTDISHGEDFARLEQLVMSNTHAADATADDVRFRCQATELLRASEPVGWWNVKSFGHELTSGNVGLGRFISMMARIVVEEIGRRLGLISSAPFRPEETGNGVAPQPRGLRPGQLVQIRSPQEIARTLNAECKNKGLWFDREMLARCGQTAHVKTKVERIIDERNGRMINIKSDAFILDGIVCESYRSEGRWFCPRAIYPYWREAWLRPLEPGASEAGPNTPAG
jgi:hypothetical protein